MKENRQYRKFLLLHFNRTLREQGIITEEAYYKMRVRTIQKYTDKTKRAPMTGIDHRGALI